VFERFTDRARRAVVLAQEEARLLNQNYIGTEHLLLGLLDEGEGVAAMALASLQVGVLEARAQVEEIVGLGGRSSSGHIPFTPRVKKVLERSLREAQQLNHDHIGTEHVLLALVREREGVAMQALANLGADPSFVRQRVMQLLSDDGKPRLIVSAQQRVASDIAARSATCSFCGRDLWEVDHYVAGPGAYICDVCIAAAHFALDDASDDQQVLRLPPRVFGVAPDVDPQALDSIIEAIHAVFGGDLTEQAAVYIEDGEQLVPIMLATRERSNVRVSEVIIRRVQFSTPNTATVRLSTPNTATVGFEVILDNSARFSFLGTMVRVGDRWLITRNTVADVLKPAGVSLPPSQ
jgi:hypothetical protein